MRQNEWTRFRANCAGDGRSVQEIAALYRALHPREAVFRGQASIVSDFKRILSAKLTMEQRLLEMSYALTAAAKRNRIKIGAAFIVGTALFVLCRLYWNDDAQAMAVVAELQQLADTDSSTDAIDNVMRRPSVSRLMKRLGQEHPHTKTIFDTVKKHPKFVARMNPPLSGLSFYKRKLFEWLMFLVLPALGVGAHFFFEK